MGGLKRRGREGRKKGGERVRGGRERERTQEIYSIDHIT